MNIIPTDNGVIDIFRIQSAVSNARDAGLISASEAKMIEEARESGQWNSTVASIISRADAPPFSLSDLQRVLASGLDEHRISQSEAVEAEELYARVYELKTASEDSEDAHKLINLINKATL